MRSRKLIIGLLALLILVSVSLSHTVDVAQAQSSPGFDLGCWGVFVSGNLRQSPNYTLHDAVGQWSGGISTTPTVSLRGGYVQDWATLDAPPAVQPTPLPQALQFYLPSIARQVRIIRTCR